MTVLDRIFYLIDKQGLTRKGVALDLGLSPAYFAERNYQHRNPSSEICQKIADYFGVSLSWILTGEENSEVIEKDLYVLVRKIDALPQIKKQLVVDFINNFISRIENIEMVSKTMNDSE
jgi:transcriptional regulator with XRE-family HTH domain